MAEAAEPDDPAATPPMEAHAGAPRAVEVVAIFGPTASGKSAVAEAVADRLGTDVVSADAMQVYRGLEILTNQPERPTRLVGICSLRRDEHRSLRRARARRARPSRRRRGTPWSPAGPASTSVPLDLDVPPPVAPGSGADREVDDDRRPRAACRPRSRRGRGRPPERPQAARPRARARGGRHVARRRSRPALAGRPGARRWSRVSTSRRTCSSGASASGRRRCSPAASSTRCGQRSRVPSRVPPRRRSGSPRSPSSDALEPLVVRTRRYAAYQRKWMRRIPDLVRFDGDRPPDEVAEEIVARVRGGHPSGRPP